MRESQFDEYTVELVESMADYGHYIQLFLAEAKDWDLGDKYQEMTTYFTDSADLNKNLSGYAFERNVGTSEVQKVSYALNLDSDTSIYLYFKMKDGYNGSVSATMDGKTVTIKKQSDGRYLVKTEGIPAHLLGKAHKFVVTTASGDTTVTMSAMCYAQNSLTKANSTDNEKNGLAAFAKYYNAATAYVNAA